jgi:ligand-binding sensor protein
MNNFNAGRKKISTTKKTRVFMKNNKSKTSVSLDNTNELIEKAAKMMSVYNHATGGNICIYDSAYKPHFLGENGENLNIPDNSIEKSICPYCTKFRPGGGDRQEVYPCHEMHINAVKEANKKGGSHVYQCGLGFILWTSPIYIDGSFSCAIRGSGFLLEDNENCEKTEENCQITVDIFSNATNNSVMCNNEISQDELKERVSS